MSTTTTLPLYRQLAAHYRGAIEAGSLQPGARLPSLRSLMQLHDVSLSTALQLCRTLESDGWAEARERSGYFVRRPQRLGMAPMDEPDADVQPDPAQYVGIHSRVSDFVARRRAADVKLNLSIARAAPQFYPADALRAAMTRALRLHPELVAGVPPLRGDPQFRAVLAKRAVAAGMVLSPDEVLVTNGCIEALNLALRAVAQPGDTIAVESPTFYGLLQVLESLGLRALEIPTSPQTGLSIEALELAARTYGDIKAVVVVPHLQMPQGSVMPDAHKERLVALCVEHGLALIEDDIYREFVESSQPMRPAKAWDRPGDAGQVIYCASLSKSFAPGLRQGWMSAGRWNARVQMIKFARTRNMQTWSQLLAARTVGSPAYERHLRRMRASLKEQREQSARAVARYFPAGTRLSLPPGGISLWLELPAGLSSSQLYDDALARGIRVAPGPMFSNTGRYERFLRLSCGMPFTPAVEEGYRVLGELLAAQCSALPKGRDGGRRAAA